MNSFSGSKIAALMVEHLHGRRDLYDVRSYNLQHNASADVVRWALKDLRTKLVSSFLIICSPSATNTVLTQVSSFYAIHGPARIYYHSTTSLANA